MDFTVSQPQGVMACENRIFCRDDRHTSRSSHDVQTQQMQKLFACLNDKLVREMITEIQSAD